MLRLCCLIACEVISLIKLFHSLASIGDFIKHLSLGNEPVLFLPYLTSQLFNYHSLLILINIYF